jgi:endoglucanase
MFNIILSLLIIVLSQSCYKENAMATPVEQYGQLSVKGNNIVDSTGQPIALKGMSSHGLQWFGKLVTKDALIDQRDNWGAKIFRAAMYTVQGGYVEHPEVKEKVKEIVDWAIELGIYVIVDWHILYDNNPQTHQKESIAFFKEISAKYAGIPNIIYEICNEPNGGISWGGNIKPYAIEVTKAIRANDKTNLILVGSGAWSQNIHDAANDPLQFPNIAYTLHFYAGTHTGWLRDRIDYARSKGIAIYVSEWGTTNSSGNGALFINESNVWLKFLADRSIGWTNWSFSNASETSAALTWNYQLTNSGRYVKQKISE